MHTIGRTMIWLPLLLLHRYLGVAIGVLMLMWFASGVVMLYVPYPSLPEKDRLAMLEPIPWQACCSIPATPLSADQRVERAEVESVAGILALRLSLPWGRFRTLTSIDTAQPEVPPDLPHARLIAAAAARRLGITPSQPSSEQTIVRDQWTVSGEYNADRPLELFGFDDRERTHIYVSSHSGRVVLRTTARQRFWNWLGAVPHWLYLRGCATARGYGANGHLDLADRAAFWPRRGCTSACGRCVQRSRALVALPRIPVVAPHGRPVVRDVHADLDLQRLHLDESLGDFWTVGRGWSPRPEGPSSHLGGGSSPRWSGSPGSPQCRISST